MIPPPGDLAPGHVGERWVVERTHRWGNAFSRLRRCTARRAIGVDCYLFLAATIVVTTHLVRAAIHDLRWVTRATTRRLR